MTREEAALHDCKIAFEADLQKADMGLVYYYKEAILEALQKQIPMKPPIWGDGFADGNLVYDMWDCPNCGKSYELDYDEYDHCPHCGQAIDWSDEE